MDEAVKKSGKTQTLQTCLGVIFVGLVASWGAWLMLSGYYEVKKSQAWPPVEGIVLGSRVRVHSERNQTDKYWIQTLYSYTVNGKEFRSDRKRIMLKDFEANFECFYTEKDAEAARPPHGKKITVYYDPYDPASAALLKEEPMAAYLYAGLGLLALGLPMLFFGIKLLINRWSEGLQ